MSAHQYPEGLRVPYRPATKGELVTRRKNRLAKYGTKKRQAIVALLAPIIRMEKKIDGIIGG